MLTSLHLNKKSREVCIKAGLPPTSFAFIGQVTENTTINWPIMSTIYYDYQLNKARQTFGDQVLTFKSCCCYEQLAPFQLIIVVSLFLYFPPTCKASVELCSHGDVSIPVPRHDTNVPCFDIWHQRV